LPSKEDITSSNRAKGPSATRLSYSITSSARAISAGETVKPSVLAVPRKQLVWWWWPVAQ